MHAIILALDTDVPKTTMSQECFNASMARFFTLTIPETRLLERITSGSQIDKRHTVVADFFGDALEGTFFGGDAKSPSPTTLKRNDLYKKAAPKLAESVCQKVLEQWGGDPKTITHVISVSCTGMMAPGIEFLLIERLGLSQEVERLGINFMGCFGAFKGLSIAKALALENPRHRVLVVCTELCSLHFQADLKKDTLVANSLFGDGAGACIVGTEARVDEKPLLEIHNQGSIALKGTEELMSWEAGNHGYEMRLSASIPTYLEQNILPFAKRLVGTHLSFDQCTWGVHPGGKAILDSITRACHLQQEQLTASWKVLRDYGNMSSSTFLFVLKEILRISCPRKWIVGLGFGPGLSIEGLLLKRVDANVAE